MAEQRQHHPDSNDGGNREIHILWRYRHAGFADGARQGQLWNWMGLWRRCGNQQGNLNAYAEAGGNSIDTADFYQFGQSEELIAILLEGRREDFAIATKYANGAQSNASRLVTGTRLHR